MRDSDPEAKIFRELGGLNDLGLLIRDNKER